MECTREWVRVLKPDGSLFVELGDKYSSASGPKTGQKSPALAPGSGKKWPMSDRGQAASGVREKSLIGLPWRYALACIDELGLILRAEIVWNHVNGLPESVTDRVRRGHSTMFHLVRQPRYYAAVDEIREAHAQAWRSGRPEEKLGQPHNHANDAQQGRTALSTRGNGREYNPLGKLPGSVWNGPIWDIPSMPLRTPECRLVWDGRTVEWFPTWADGHARMRGLARDRWAWSQHQGRPSLRAEADHFAAFPLEVPRRVILGWSPPGVCVVCGEGRRPVAAADFDTQGRTTNGPKNDARRPAGARNMAASIRSVRSTTITGYACACTTVADHLPPTRPALILDPFGGTGSTALVASTLGRDAITLDMSQDYSRLARWRTQDRPEVARAMGVRKPPPPPPVNQSALF